jgi:chromodomain-helicase-DNA-binding protein 1
LAPRAARNNRSYVENEQPEKPTGRKSKNSEPREKPKRRSARVADASFSSAPYIEGASAQVREWSFGNLTKKDASHFVRAVMSLAFIFGNV